ncbi:zinc finger MYM-type protein 1-like [Aphis craccivora]|uniref:Zinc finger MYM-type protein 1-like n=1 Tax=Aphis craccivora TaxID=307492 RepID=A0A6G0YXK2_APHCR|nr:zinc finger MYM-type protein 1-like [Aphis craccivora]
MKDRKEKDVSQINSKVLFCQQPLVQNVINMEKRFSTESLKMASAVDNFFKLNFNESKFFIEHYQDLLSISNQNLRSEMTVAKNFIKSSCNKNDFELEDIKKKMSQNKFTQIYTNCCK